MACRPGVAGDCWVDPCVEGVTVAGGGRPNGSRHRSDGASVAVGVSVGGAVACRDGCRGSVSPPAVLAGAGVAPRLVALLWLPVRADGRYLGPLPVSEKLRKGVVRVRIALGGVLAHVRDVVDVLGLGEQGRVDGSLVGWAVEAETPAVSAIVVEFSVRARVADEGIAKPCVVVQRH